MFVDKIVAVVVWGYALLFAVTLGIGIPSQVGAMGMTTDSISLGIALIFWAVSLILFLGFALSGWSDDLPTPESGYFVDWFGAERVAAMIRRLRPNLMLMIAAGLTGVLGVGITLATHRSGISLCLSSYFLAVGLGNLYAFLFNKKRRGQRRPEWRRCAPQGSETQARNHERDREMAQARAQRRWYASPRPRP